MSFAMEASTREYLCVIETRGGIKNHIALFVSLCVGISMVSTFSYCPIRKHSEIEDAHGIVAVVQMQNGSSLNYLFNLLQLFIQSLLLFIQRIVS